MSLSAVFSVSDEAELNAAIDAIDISGTLSATNASYEIAVASDISLSSNIDTINLATGDSLSILGDNLESDTGTIAQIDGHFSGFFINAGAVALSNLTLNGLSAPGGAGGVPGGGGAIYVGQGATVTTTAVSFSNDTARGGTPAGGTIFIAQGGTFVLSGGTIAANGTIAGTAAFIAGFGSITLANTTVTGTISDQTGAQLGNGMGSVVIDGAVTLATTNNYTGGTDIEAASALTLAALGAAGTGPISFIAPTGESLMIDLGDMPANVVNGFIPNTVNGAGSSDTIDLQGIGAPIGYTQAADNELTITGSLGIATLKLDPTQSYGADSFVLTADPNTGPALGTDVSVIQTSYVVNSWAGLNAALAAIDISGAAAAANQAYSIIFAANITLSADLDAINLSSGDTLTINGSGYTLDGGGLYRGFFDYAGHVTLQQLTIQNAVASGGAGGTGATPGGGGAGLGGGLFVASGATATLQNVNFLDESAVGGAGGGGGGLGIGGGGGLGGAGGAGAYAAAGALNLAGGGGGIGLTATGGSGAGSGGGPGIVIGAAGGAAGSLEPAGPDGGGGGGAGVKVTSGSGSGRGGGGHTSYTAGTPGSGGVGGSFGGGAAAGGAAGFGGGGADSTAGWGGGGSGAFAGGFGGGAGGGAAGGGIGAGGAVFVEQGGALTIEAGALAGGSVAGGGGSGAGGTGLALGSGIFMQGANALTLAPAAGQLLSINDVIGNSAGAGDTLAPGATSSLILSGPGTVALAADNSFAGGITLSGGTLDLLAPGAAGSGLINFASGGDATLSIGAGDVPANQLSGFLPGETIDLRGIGLAASATLAPGDVLEVTGGASNVQLALDPAQNFTGETFLPSSDGNGGTDVTAVDVNNDAPPSFFGTGYVTGNDHTPSNPLAGVVLSDLIAGAGVTATLTLSSVANGTLSNLAGGIYDPATGVYTLTGSAAALTAALEGLVFTPTINQRAPGQSVTTSFTLSATDGQMTSITRVSTVNVTALNDPPVITVPATPYGNDVYGYWNVPLNPFAGATVTDPDVGATETARFTLSSSVLGFGDVNGLLSLSLPGYTLTHTSNGTYTLSGGSTPADITAAINAIQYTPTPYPNESGATSDQVTITVSDGIAPAVTNSVDVVAGGPVFTGIEANQAVTDGQSIQPFANVAITDTAGHLIQSLTISLFNQPYNVSYAGNAGTLTGNGLNQTGYGVYTLTPGTPAQVSAELDSLVFTPTESNSAATTCFYVVAADAATTSGNDITSVIASPGPVVPVINGTAAGQAVLDDTTIKPFGSISVSDATPSALDSAAISLLSSPISPPSDANGTLVGPGLTETSPGVYSLAATSPLSLSNELAALVFTPTYDEVPPGSTVTTTFDLAVSDSAGTANDATTSVVASASASDPVISGSLSGQIVEQGGTITPFSGVTITDANPSPTDTLLITVNDVTNAGSAPSDADGTLAGAGLSYLGTGTYELAAGDPNTITSELQALVFTTPADRLSAGQTATAQFTLQVTDNLAVASDDSASVIETTSPPPTIALNAVNGTNTVDAAQAASGFTITGTTTNVEDGQTVFVGFSSAASGNYGIVIPAAVSNGTWSAAVSPAQALALGNGIVTVNAYVTNAESLTTPAVSETISITTGNSVACFVAGTKVRTDRGEIAVEALAVGDRVITHRGEARSLVWIGRRDYHPRIVLANPHVLPLLIRADAFADGVPTRDLHVSPLHAFYFDGILIPAAALVNGVSILKLSSHGALRYFHLECDAHDIIFAEGAPAETYIDHDNRGMFNNAAEYRGPIGGVARREYAPRLDSGPKVAAVWSRLARRAGVGGGNLPPPHQVMLTTIGLTQAWVPPGITELHLVSDAGHAPGDCRRLGALLHELWLDDVSVDLSDSRLVRGFHAIEYHGSTMVRWTNGEGALLLPRHDKGIWLKVSVGPIMSSDHDNLSLRPGERSWSFG